MGTLRTTLIGLVAVTVLATSAGYAAMLTHAADGNAAIGPGLVTGPGAYEVFQSLAADGTVAFTDFEGVPTGPHLSLELDGPGAGITLTMRTTELRYPPPPKPAPQDTPVLVLPYSFVAEPANHRLMGANPNDTPDGQARYQLVLSSPVRHVGLLRTWTTNSLTRFYDADGALLAEHRNTANQEFVGYVAHGPGDQVKTVEFDGIPAQPGNEANELYQVGEVDDLYVGYGSAWAEDEEQDGLEAASIDEIGEAAAPAVPFDVAGQWLDELEQEGYDITSGLFWIAFIFWLLLVTV